MKIEDLEQREYVRVWMRVKCASNWCSKKYAYTYVDAVKHRIKEAIKSGETNNPWEVY